jgi:uncharacterized protein YdcH (DUF465 family)
MQAIAGAVTGRPNASPHEVIVTLKKQKVKHPV